MVIQLVLLTQAAKVADGLLHAGSMSAETQVKI
jgi:hypothetical protein